jgi:hypothetical protein
MPTAPVYQAMTPLMPAEPGRPTAAFVLSLIGGIFILLGGAWLFELGAAASAFGFFAFGGGLLMTLGSIGAVSGILCVVLGVLLWIMPAHRTIFAVLIIVLSIVSLASLGGFIIGFVLALVGGILGLTWKPTPAVIYAPVHSA